MTWQFKHAFTVGYMKYLATQKCTVRASSVFNHADRSMWTWMNVRTPRVTSDEGHERSKDHDVTLTVGHLWLRFKQSWTTCWRHMTHSRVCFIHVYHSFHHMFLYRKYNYQYRSTTELQNMWIAWHFLKPLILQQKYHIQIID